MTISFHEAENSSFQEVLKLNADTISNLCASILIYISTVFENYDRKGESVTADSVKIVSKFFSPITNFGIVGIVRLRTQTMEFSFSFYH
jgi:hypothetical protein